MQSIEDTANEINIFAKGKNSLQSVMNNIRTISEFLNYFQRKNSEDTATVSVDKKSVELNTSFSGQHTDIAFAARDGGLNKKEIDGISDDTLRQNVQCSYNDAVSDGFVNYNYDNCSYTLTEKGKEHINERAFFEQFEKDQYYIKTQNKAQITLQGSAKDLNAFRYTNSLNLNQIMTSDPKTFKKIVSYFEDCKKYNFVNITDDGIVTPTAKCMDYLSQNQDAVKYSVNKITPQNVESVYTHTQGVKSGATNVTAQSSSQSAVSAGRTATAAGKTTATATGKAAATAEKTAATAGKTATTAGTGAATAGATVAATAVIDLSKKGLDALKNAPDIHSSKINNRNN